MADFITNKNVGFIGCGNMGSAIIKALSASYPNQSFYLFDKDLNKSQALAQDSGKCVEAVSTLADLLALSQTLFIGVKPKDLDDLLLSVKPFNNQESKLWISMVVGRSLDSIQADLPSNHSLIRIMPNTPVAIGEGFISYCYQADGLKKQSIDDFTQFMAPLGKLQYVEENLFDIASAIAGSAPAFIYQLIEAMGDAGVYHGLSRKQAIEMSAKTVVGAGQMVLKSHKHPAELKDAVTSPNGTTIAGIRSLEASGFRSAIFEAILATIERT
ncbi:pyrroline-5-carboxylate reductase [Facklamia miroungae]|uniref:Pyrroline-5-carboxylate reductase n=1 Tax=Facklamia miroungae TaxID=120956 RepID=A0A1G7P8P8_9LACT|nr:pyrroline-5-carboxylate reductase [Facklamia miroungae]NKZ28601.1 pyrroline-5-carboxylate reductase [Facklamia miroungae]SDF81969.1 pyrroline-5-carboxylate reductase [Facklamia miroungae]